MKNKRVFCLMLCLILIVSALLLPVCAEGNTQEDVSVSRGPHTLDGQVPVLGTGMLVSNTQSALAYEVSSGTLLYAWNADAQMYPASMVKIMTALIALEQGDLSDKVIANPGTLSSISSGAITAGIQPGEIMSLENLLYCMLVYSANDAAAVIAEHIGGTQEAFVEKMNSYALQLGCTNTHFTNVHGLHDPEQLSTVRDIARILEAALQHEEFQKIFTTSHYTVPATNMRDERNLSTRNYLLNDDIVSTYYDSRVKGSRLGEDNNGLRSVASYAESGNMQVICIVAGTRSQYLSDGYTVQTFGGFPETTELLDQCFSGFSKRQIAFEGQALRQNTVLNGDSDVFVAPDEPLATVLPTGVTLSDLNFQYVDIAGSDQAPVEKGQQMALLQVWYGAVCVGQTYVHAMNDVPYAYVKTVMPQALEQPVAWWVILLIALGIFVLLAVVTLFIVRLMNKKRFMASKRRKAKRNRGER